MPSYDKPDKAGLPTIDEPNGCGGGTVDQGGSDSVSPHQLGESIQRKPKAHKGMAKVGMDKARDAAEPVKAVECEVVHDRLPDRGGGNPKTSKAKVAKVLDMVLREGRTQASACQVVGVAPATVHSIVNASGEQVEALEKGLIPRLWKIAALSGENLVSKLENDGHRMSGSELSIVQGVAIQRAVDLAKMPRKEAPPDWSQLAGWAGTPIEPEQVMESPLGDKAG